MRISDGSSDVCSSDLILPRGRGLARLYLAARHRRYSRPAAGPNHRRRRRRADRRADGEAFFAQRPADAGRHRADRDERVRAVQGAGRIAVDEWFWANLTVTPPPLPFAASVSSTF